MRSTLFSLGGIDVPSHATFVALGLLVGLLVFLAEARRRAAWDDRLIPILAGLLIGGAVGERLAGVLDAASRGGVGAAAWAWQAGGRSILGGLTGAYVGVVIAKRAVGYTGRTGDLFAPAVALGLAVGRIGCFLAEAPGRPTSLPWGITVSKAAAATIPQCPGCLAGLPMHPSFLYEIGFLVAAFFWLRRIRDRVRQPGELFVLFLIAYGLFRFGVEFTRANPADLLGLTRSQLFILCCSPLLVWRIAKQRRLGVYREIQKSNRTPQGAVR